MIVQNLKTKNFLRRISNLWPIIFLIITISVFSFMQPALFTLQGIQNILLAATLISIVGAAETLIIISGGIDLSAQYVMGLNAVITGLIIKKLATIISVPIAIIIGVFGGLLFSLIPGLINGLLIAKVRIPSFIATIGMMTIAQGAVYLACNGMTLAGLPLMLSDIGNYHLLYYLPGKGISFIRPEGFGSMPNLVQILPYPVLFTSILLMLIYFILHKTLFGRYIYAIGSNSDASSIAGVPVNTSLILVYVLGSLFYGIAGIMYILRFGNASPNMGQAMLLMAIGAVFIGGAGMSGGTGTLTGTILGALIVASIQTGLSTAGVKAFYQYIAIGFVILFAVLFDRIKLRLIL